jgi:hypothetical protein
MSQISNLVTAYDRFITGCKADGIWDAIKACCIMSGWDGLNGALTPLKGPAPTNFNFINDDYDRKTGLLGDGSTKYLNSNRNDSADPQNNHHLACNVTKLQTAGTFAVYIGTRTSTTSQSTIGRSGIAPDNLVTSSRTGGSTFVGTNLSITAGFFGLSRNGSSNFIARGSGSNEIIVASSTSSLDKSMHVFQRNADDTNATTDARLSFYSIGEALDLALLDTRVSTLMNDINFAMGEFDIDANAYIFAVETADGQSLETEIKVAIDTFIKGCKADGTWDSIKSSCILAGARTLQGALVPLKGAAPTNYAFISDDYDRKTGLLGNGTNKYLDSNRNNNADPQNNKSVSNWVTVAGTLANVSLGSGGGDVGATTISAISGGGRNNCSTLASGGLSGYTGLSANSRSQSSGYTRRVNNTDFAVTQASQTPQDRNIFVFATNFGTNPGSFCNNRMSFYHIGEALDLAALDSRVSTLMNDINSAIP